MSRPSIQVSFDPKARAAYVRLSSSAVAETVEAAHGLLLDLDYHGNVVGIEILTVGTLPLLLQPASPEMKPYRLPNIDRSQVEKIERMFEMSA